MEERERIIRKKKTLIAETFLERYLDLKEDSVAREMWKKLEKMPYETRMAQKEELSDCLDFSNVESPHSSEDEFEGQRSHRADFW